MHYALRTARQTAEEPVINRIAAPSAPPPPAAPLAKPFCRHAVLVAVTALVATAAFAPPAASAQGLSRIEREIVSYIDEHTEDAIGFLERVVNVNSGTMNFEGVRQVGRMFRAEFDALGFATQWIPMDEVERAGHLFAERQGSVGKRVLLIGHLDTVFEKDSPFRRFERHDSIAKGPGVEDMKGGDVVILLALKALQAVGALDGASIIVAFTGDEEDTNDPLSIDRGDLIDAARRSDIALGFEGGVGGMATATVARRGFTGWVLRVTGTPAHSSQIFREDLGSGAIFGAARILNAFHEELRGEQYLTFNPGMVVGGTTVEFDAMHSRGTAFGKTNVIAETAVVAGDLRTISGEQRERTKERMRSIVARHLPHTSAEIDFRDSYPPMAPTSQNYELFGRLDQVSRDLGLGPIEVVDPGQRGAADISFVASHVDASLAGLGVVGEGAHTAEETVDLRSIPIVAKRAAVLIYRLTREEPGM